MAAAGVGKRPAGAGKPVQERLDVALGAGPKGGGVDAPGEPGYSGKQTCQIVGITYRQLDYWDRKHLVKPSLAEAHGSGSQRRYSYRDLVRLRVVKSLLDAGVKLENARRAIEYLREEEGADWQAASLVLAGPNSVLARDGDALIDLVRRGQGVLNIVPMGAVVGDVDSGINDLGTKTTSSKRAVQGG
ncbi:MAG TPA: MerR family transcriptional regulator [Acidimicrobiia bacterium]|nr:MerR family transcriptional regulator [Acidimicrobiia bacterium]